MNEEIKDILGENTEDKLVRISFVVGILKRLFEYLPFKSFEDGSVVHIDKDGNTTNIVSNALEVALGKYNVTKTGTIFSIGVGTSDNDRKNAFRIDDNGEIFIISDLSSGKEVSLQSLLEETGNVDFSNYFTKTEVNDLINNAISNSVISNYYTKGEIDNIVTEYLDKTDLTNYYTKTETDDLLTDVVDTVTVVTESGKETTIRELANIIEDQSKTIVEQQNQIVEMNQTIQNINDNISTEEDADDSFNRIFEW